MSNDIGMSPTGRGSSPPSDIATTLTSALRVAHFVAQKAHHHTDTDPPDRHTSLNPRALAVQKDVLDGFL